MARTKLNSTESKILMNLNIINEALMNHQLSHENFMTIINEERNYREVKEIIRIMNGQEDKKVDID